MSVLTKVKPKAKTNNQIAKRDNGLSLFGDLTPWGAFNDLFDFRHPFISDFRSGYPITEDNDKECCMEFDMPGLEKEDIDISVKDGYLSIKGHKCDGKRERNYSQMIRLGDTVTDEDIKAEYHSGVLALKILKREAEKSIKKITIQ